jgi:hypothetical protein
MGVHSPPRKRGEVRGACTSDMRVWRKPLKRNLNMRWGVGDAARFLDTSSWVFCSRVGRIDDVRGRAGAPGSVGGGCGGRKQVLEHGVRVGGIGDGSWQAGANGD